MLALKRAPAHRTPALTGANFNRSCLFGTPRLAEIRKPNIKYGAADRNKPANANSKLEARNSKQTVAKSVKTRKIQNLESGLGSFETL